MYINGDQENNFNPHAAISREEMAKDYVAQGITLGLMKGRSDQLFTPKGKLTRAESVQVIYNLIVVK